MGCNWLLSTVEALLICAFGAVAAAPARAQVHGGPVRQDSGPVSERSTSVRTGSGSVSESGGSVRESTGGRLGGSSVRDSTSRDLVSGPVSEVSVGPVTSSAVAPGGAVGDVSVGAVTKDVQSPIREDSTAPVRDLGPLQRQLRALQPLPRDEALEPAEEPLSPANDENVPAEAGETEMQPEEVAGGEPTPAVSELEREEAGEPTIEQQAEVAPVQEPPPPEEEPAPEEQPAAEEQPAPEEQPAVEEQPPSEEQPTPEAAPAEALP